MDDKRVKQLSELEPRILETAGLIGIVATSLCTASIWLIVAFNGMNTFGLIVGGLQAVSILSFLWGIKDRTKY
jgi:hypothetical protein